MSKTNQQAFAICHYIVKSNKISKMCALATFTIFHFKNIQVMSQTGFKQQVHKHLPWQDLPALHVVIWLSTFFIVLQCGNVQASPLVCSRLWHLCAWRSRTSCCCISLRFSGSADWVCAPVPAAAGGPGMPGTPGWGTGWVCGTCCCKQTIHM